MTKRRKAMGARRGRGYGQCKTCQSPSVRAIEEALLAGRIPRSKIAAMYKVPYRSIQNHWHNHMSARSNAGRGKTLEAKVVGDNISAWERLGIGRKADRRRRFILELLARPDLNATAAAMLAGYAPKTAADEASKLMANRRVREAIAEKVAERNGALQVRGEHVIMEIARLAAVDVREFLRWDESGKVSLIASKHLGPEARAIKKITFRESGSVASIELYDKPRLLDLLLRHRDKNLGRDPLEEENKGEIRVIESNPETGEVRGFEIPKLPALTGDEPEIVDEEEQEEA